MAGAAHLVGVLVDFQVASASRLEAASPPFWRRSTTLIRASQLLDAEGLVT